MRTEDIQYKSAYLQQDCKTHYNTEYSVYDQPMKKYQACKSYTARSRAPSPAPKHHCMCTWTHQKCPAGTDSGRDCIAL